MSLGSDTPRLKGKLPSNRRNSWAGPSDAPPCPLCPQCLGHDVNVLIDTGCGFNLMSSSTADRFGSVYHVQRVDSLLTPREWTFVSVHQSEGAGGGEQSGGGGSPVSEEALCGRPNPRSQPDCRPAKNPVLLRCRRWGTKGQRFWCSTRDPLIFVSFSRLLSGSNRPLISLGNKTLKSLKVSEGTVIKADNYVLISSTILYTILFYFSVCDWYREADVGLWDKREGTNSFCAKAAQQKVRVHPAFFTEKKDFLQFHRAVQLYWYP